MANRQQTKTHSRVTGSSSEKQQSSIVVKPAFWPKIPPFAAPTTARAKERQTHTLGRRIATCRLQAEKVKVVLLLGQERRICSGRRRHSFAHWSIGRNHDGPVWSFANWRSPRGGFRRLVVPHMSIARRDDVILVCSTPLYLVELRREARTNILLAVAVRLGKCDE